MTTASAIRGIATLLGLLTAAKTAAGAPPPVQLDIRSVVVSYKSSGEPDTLLISGINFGSLPGVVTLNSVGQTVTHWTPSWIAATVADVVEPGTYELDVQRTDTQGHVFRDQADVAIGATGPRGPAGPEGPQGAAGVLGYEMATGHSEVHFPARQERSLLAQCPTGKKVLGGGCNLQDLGAFDLELTSSYATSSGIWLCRWRNRSDEDVTAIVTAKASCATVP